MADVEENVKQNSEETVEGSHSEKMSSELINSENDVTTKTFKDLVGL